jgi:hypothetical protein
MREEAIPTTIELPHIHFTIGLEEGIMVIINSFKVIVIFNSYSVRKFLYAIGHLKSLH